MIYLKPGKNRVRQDDRYTVNMQKSISFLHTRNEQVNIEIKSVAQLTLALPKNKCKSNNICTNLYWEVYKNLMKESYSK
jgi:hypothetical protein